MAWRRRQVVMVVALAVLGTFAAAAGLGILETGGEAGASPEGLVEPLEERGKVWPYTSRSPDGSDRTLAINLLAVGEPDAVRRVIERVPRANWSASPYPGAPANETQPLIDDDSDLVWLPARGTARYGYVQPPNGDGRWVGVSYQLFDGSYLGTRDHLRAYVVPGASLTAMQVHREYWDWFRLRHTVTSTLAPRDRLEGEFRADGRVRSVEQVDLGTDGAADSDGFATLIRLASLAGAVTLVGGGYRIPAGRKWVQAGRLFGAVLGVVLLVRLGGMGLEGLTAAIPPKLVAAGLYPVLAVGLPFTASRLAGDDGAPVAGLAAAGGLGVAFLLEHVVIGMPSLPVDLQVHRLGLVLALGAIAAGSASARVRGRRVLFVTGGGGWFLGLALVLFGVV